MASINEGQTELPNQNEELSLTQFNGEGSLEDLLSDPLEGTQRPTNTLPPLTQASLPGDNKLPVEPEFSEVSHSKTQFTSASFRDNEFTTAQLVEDGVFKSTSTTSYNHRPTLSSGDAPLTEKEHWHLSVSTVRKNEVTAEQRGPKLLLQPPDEESGFLSDDAYSQKGISAPESLNSDFTNVATIVDFGLGIGMDHVRTQIQDGQLCPQFSTRIKDNAIDELHSDSSSTPLQMAKSGRDSSSILNGIGSSFETQLDSQKPRTQLVDDLSDQLEAEQTESQHNPNERFLPWDKLFMMLNESNIEMELKRVFHKDQDQVRQIVNNIYQSDLKQSRRLIMAILSSINKVGSIVLFIKHQVFDSDLPLARHIDERQRNVPLFYRSRDSVGCDEPLSFLHKHWKGRELDHFCRVQYSFLVPFFDMRGDQVSFYKIEDRRIILPFLKWEKQESGGYGTVWKAHIHPAHHNYPFEDENTDFAVKEIHSSDYEAYKEEVRVLERYSGRKKGHEHLIRLLMAFQHNSQYYLVFPLARGNLKDLWQTTRKQPTNSSDVLWVLQQCLGIAEGLWKIHEHKSWFAKGLAPSGDEDKNRGRHGDIKPQNILAFEDSEKGYYRLVISDFGLTRFHSAQSISNVPPDKVGGLSRTYRAPEYDLKSTISQAYDMWSLGCLYLELISWFLLGFDDGPNKFAFLRGEDDIPTPGLPPVPNYTEDKFFNIDGKEPVLKESVKKWFDELRRQPNCPPCISDFLDFIQSDLLNPTKTARSKIAQLHSKLKQILVDSKKKSNYCVFTTSNSVSSEPIEVMSSTRRPHSPRGESQEKRRESLKLQQIILEQRDKYRFEEKRASLDLTIRLASQPHTASESPKPGSTVITLRRQDGRLSLESSESTIKEGNYIISSLTDSRGSQKRQIPRSPGNPPENPPENPSFTRNITGATDTTFNASQVSAAESFSTKNTTPPLTTENSRECSPELSDMPTTLAVTKANRASLKMEADEPLTVKAEEINTVQPRPQHPPQDLAHKVSESLIQVEYVETKPDKPSHPEPISNEGEPLSLNVESEQPVQRNSIRKPAPVVHHPEPRCGDQSNSSPITGTSTPAILEITGPTNTNRRELNTNLDPNTKRVPKRKRDNLTRYWRNFRNVLRATTPEFDTR
ncbi:hypothetical protein HD806DRAFT_491453 [Xylariaceae sp. AK1471]|nr:hypothetical protein HD806DRAFT_491453 [Xylariaceae sp. AK1471]